MHQQHLWHCMLFKYHGGSNVSVVTKKSKKFMGTMSFHQGQCKNVLNGFWKGMKVLKIKHVKDAHQMLLMTKYSRQLKVNLLNLLKKLKKC